MFALLPVYVMVSSSLKPLQDVTSTFRWIPSPLSRVSPYLHIWQTVPLARYFLNSLIVSTCGAALSVAGRHFAAYAVSRYRFRGRRIFTAGRAVHPDVPGDPVPAPAVPDLRVDRERDRDHAATARATGLVITYLTFSLPFSIWMLVGYFDSIPRGLDEAALVDGCGPVRALFRVVIPAAIPGIITVAIYAFMTAWSEVLFASVMTNDTTRTLAVGLRDYSTQNDVYWNQIMAASIVVSVPVVAGFLLMQRFLVTGLTAGAVK